MAKTPTLNDVHDVIEIITREWPNVEVEWEDDSVLVGYLNMRPR